MVPSQTMATIIMCVYTFVRSAKSSVGTRIAVKIMMPPIVGVPRFSI